MRIDCKYRIDPTNNQFEVQHSVSGNTTLTLTEGVYDSLADLCTEIQTQLVTADPQLTCSESEGFVSMTDTNNDNFAVQWDHPPLMTWLGWTTHLSGSDSYTASSMCAGSFVATLPWYEAAPMAWEWSTKRWDGENQTGGSIKLGKLTRWFITAHCTGTEGQHFRSVLSHMMAGTPARWWRDTGTATAFSYANWDGFVDVLLAPEMRAYAERLTREDLPLHWSIPLEFVVEG